MRPASFAPERNGPEPAGNGPSLNLSSTAADGFGARVEAADNWGVSYNVVVGAGDITGDGRADLVSRDTTPGKSRVRFGHLCEGGGPRRGGNSTWADTP